MVNLDKGEESKDENLQKIQINCNTRKKGFRVRIPIQDPGDIYDRKGAWRVWSSMYLAYLLDQTMDSVSEPLLQSGLDSKEPLCREGTFCGPQTGRSLQRRFWTRRTKHWWKQTENRTKRTIGKWKKTAAIALTIRDFA